MNVYIKFSNKKMYSLAVKELTTVAKNSETLSVVIDTYDKFSGGQILNCLGDIIEYKFFEKQMFLAGYKIAGLNTETADVYAAVVIEGSLINVLKVSGELADTDGYFFPKDLEVIEPQRYLEIKAAYKIECY